MTASTDDVLSFWFGENAGATTVAKRQERLWWSGAADVDASIRARFADTHADAVAGRLGPWLATPRGRLAAIVVVDQFSRNLFRGRPESFAYDDLARGWCLEGLMLKVDRALAPIERVFFYLPLEHSELAEDQERSVAVCDALAREVPEAERALFEYYASFAHSHRDAVVRFGRFPTRNAVLGRASTPDEIEFLRTA